MNQWTDAELLSAYATRQSEEAFEALVGRYVALVYSAALRQVQNSHLAEEITQAVFTILAQKARQLNDRTILAGWLCRTAHFVSRNALKAEYRRQSREKEAHMQALIDEPQADAWPQFAPLLDQAVAQLNETDRNAVVLRFYEKKPLTEVGTIMGINADTAQKRVTRALDKLRKFFEKHGVNSTAAAIGESISIHSVSAVPLGFAKVISVVAVAKGATASASTLTLIKGTLKAMAWTKAKTAIVAGTIALVSIGSATVLVDKIVWPPQFVEISGHGQIELFTKPPRIVETAKITIQTDGKLYNLKIVSSGDGILTNNADDMSAEYGSDGIDTFVLSDRFTPFHRTRDGMGGIIFSGRFPREATAQYVPLVVQAAWLGYCSETFLTNNQTGVKLGNSFSMIWPDYVTNLVTYWTNSISPQSVTGWSRNWMLGYRTNSLEQLKAIQLDQYPDGFKAWKFTAADPVMISGKPVPRQVTLETFFPKFSRETLSGDDTIPMRTATFTADSIKVVKGKLDPLPKVTVPDLQAEDLRFEEVSGNFVIGSHATPRGWPVRDSKEFLTARAQAEKLGSQNKALIRKDRQREIPVEP